MRSRMMNSHRQYGQTEGKGNPDKTNTQEKLYAISQISTDQGCGKNGTATATKDEPEGSNKLSKTTFC